VRVSHEPTSGITHQAMRITPVSVAGHCRYATASHGQCRGRGSVHGTFSGTLKPYTEGACSISPALCREGNGPRIADVQSL
jgi:hypothetical protein